MNGNVANQQTPAAAAPDHQSADVAPIMPLLEMMNALPQGDPARQAELFQSAKDAASLTPTTSNRLRYALALATPGHGGSDLVAAQRQLSELLARPETLLATERLLALVELQEVDQRLVLQAENKRLRDEESHDSRDKLSAVNRRLAAESDENARLRKALDEARAKLEAITHIERSINDRGTNAPPAP
jgi:predicted O-linked N-acetylglucosamine transferase (SPINDLY family)